MQKELAKVVAILWRKSNYALCFMDPIEMKRYG